MTSLSPAALRLLLFLIPLLWSFGGAWDLRHKQHHAEGATCTSAADCKPTVHKINAHSLWLWCGWSGQQSFQYSVKAISTQNTNAAPKVVVANRAPFLIGGQNAVLSAMVMQQEAAQSCIPEFFGGCQYISDSECLFSTECSRTVNGRLLGGQICLGIVNDSDDDVSFILEAFQTSRHNHLIALGVVLLLVAVFVVIKLLVKLSRGPMHDRKQPLLGY